MMVRYNKTGTYLMMQDIEIREINSDLIEMENDFVDIGTLEEDRSITQRLEALAETVYKNLDSGSMRETQLQNRTESSALGDLNNLNWKKVFGLDIEAVYHGVLAVIGTATGVVVLICLC